MGWMAKFFRRLALLVRRDRFRSELSEEMAFHRAQAEEELRSAGFSARQARRQTQMRFGNTLKLRDQSQEAVAFRWESVGQDLRYAMRQMLRSPGFTLAVVLTMALGIGANTAIFSVVEATLLRPLPYPGADRIVRISDERTRGDSTGGLVGVLRFYDLEQRNRSFDSVAFFYFGDSSTLIYGTHLPESVYCAGASGQFWRVLGGKAMLGRTFHEQDDLPNAPPVVVLGYGLWEGAFGRDRAIVGKAVTINKQPATVIGVMPRGFDYPGKADMWKPAQFDPNGWKGYRGDGSRFLNVIARRKPGVSQRWAESELAALGEQLASEHPDTDGPWRFRSVSLRDSLYGQVKPALLVLAAASFLLLLIACVNVANLLLSKATAREAEITLRQALGASRGRVLRQILTESILLAFGGGLIGVGAAGILVRIAAARLPGILGTPDAIRLDWRVATMELAMASGAGILFGLAPAWRTLHRGLNSRMKDGETRMAGASGSRLRGGFIAVQVGLSMVLLVGACLLAQSLWKLTGTPLGFEPERLVTFQVVLPWESKPENADRFFTEAQRRIEALPGVEAAGQISAPPTVGWHTRSSFDTDWMARTPHRDAVNVEVRAIRGNYLRAMGIPLLAGRDFRAADKSVVLVNEEFVRRYLPLGNPVGRHLVNDQSVEVIGVIGNVRGTAGSLAAAVQPEVYFPANGLNGGWFVIRSAVPAEVLEPEIRRAIHEVDSQQSIGHVQTMEDRLSSAVAQPRLNMALLVAFAGIALVLACVGIYGVVAYSVAQRRQEIGVRMALGATRGQISLLFLRRTIAAALIGLGGGGVATLFLTRLLRSQLYGITPNDPRTFSVAVLLLLVPVLAASLRPALRAASLDPVEALRTE
jgi:predicted permease